MNLFQLKLMLTGCILFSFQLTGQSRAHDLSKPFIIDPAYSGVEVVPASQIKSGATPWIYGSGEFEAWRLKLLLARKDSAELKVGYPGTYHQPYSQITYRFVPTTPVTLNRLVLRRVGQGRIYINGRMVQGLRRNRETDTLFLDPSDSIHEVRISLSSPTDPPTLLIEEGAIATGNLGWQWQVDSGPWQPVTQYAQNSSNLPPHRLEDPIMNLKPESVQNGIFDFGRELYGYIVIRSAQEPTLYFGESETEARDIENTVLEQTRKLIPYGKDLWRSKVPLAFRYAFLPGLPLENVHCESIIRPEMYRGAFASSDPLLNEIWMKSAYTLRLNMHDFLLDGMKRDRLPWTGDMAMSMLVNSFTFADQEVARRSLVGLGRAGIAQTDINGIVDYSLWWIIAQDQYQRYYGDSEHLEREWYRIQKTLEILISRTDPDGFLKVSPEDWVFIDWVNQPKWTALQVMWWWAQRSAMQLASRMKDHKGVQFWVEKSKVLQENLQAVAWDPNRMAWLSSPDSTRLFTRHPNFLAVVSGLTKPDSAEGILKLLEDNSVAAVGTPYMAGFEMMGLSRLGNIDYTLDKISEYWGGMINRGATSFWEAYDANQNGPEQYAYYGRPYAKSLNHAWSAGPAAILPAEILGIRLLEDGWRRVAIDPNLGALKWVHVAVPLPKGLLTIDVEKNQITVALPKGVILELYGEEIEGPSLFTRKLKRKGLHERSY
ncbi:MAG: hypothetical protein RLZZ241_2386 [Bacteroidota bacterium]|jgi:hypothetical protein